MIDLAGVPVEELVADRALYARLLRRQGSATSVLATMRAETLASIDRELCRREMTVEVGEQGRNAS